VRRLQDGVAPLLWLHARVCRATRDLDREVRDPLARRDDVAVRPSAFQHQRGVVLGSELADDRSGEGRADLLVGVAHVGDRPEAVEADVSQDVCREEPGEETRLHIGDAGPPGDVAVHTERPHRHRAVVEDGVHVPDQQDVGSTRAVEPADQKVPEPRIGVVRAPLDLPAVVLEPPLTHVGDPVHALRRVRATVDVDHGLQRFQELGVTGVCAVAERLNVHA